MIGHWLQRLFAGRGRGAREPLARWTLDELDTIFAIGDVHGQLDLLRDLEREILEDGERLAGNKTIIMLGDLIDRGPRSAQVIDHVLRPLPPGWQRLSLCGNHEITMLEALKDRRVLKNWLGFGGLETLGSYGIGNHQLFDAIGNQHKLSDLLTAHIPTDHIAFLSSLPSLIATGHFVFTHAGVRPGIGLDEQSDDDLLWYQGEREDCLPHDGRVLVHGHQIVQEPYITPGRVNVDLGAYATGRLAGVGLVAGESPRVIMADPGGINQINDRADR